MSVDKLYCMSSYLAFRYVEDTTKLFFNGLYHNRMPLIPEQDRKPVKTALEIDAAIEKSFSLVRDERLGILLSGGMDSAILASYMKGADAYTFRFHGGQYQSEELHRAEYYADYNGLKLHYVDIDWDHVEKYIDMIMEQKGAPVHSIETQILKGALQAKDDGITTMIIGESSDLIFGGMDKLLAEDWTVEGFSARYTFTPPEKVLKNSISMQYLFEKYRKEGGQIDYLQFMDDVFSVESSNSYYNAFQTANMPYLDPYAHLIMAEPLDLCRVRGGESKYLIRELFSMKYPNIAVPEKVPMPRPVDFYFADWMGPTRPEFKNDLNMNDFTGNQKWQLWCLERFLNKYEPIYSNLEVGD